MKLLNNYSALVDAIIQAEMEGVKEREKILFLGDTPDYIIKAAGFPSLMLAIKASTIAKAAFDHGMPKSFLKRLPEVIANPKALYRSTSETALESVVVLTFEDHRGFPIIIPIRPTAKVGRNQIHNLVTSVYGKEGPDVEKRWEESLLWPES